MCYNKICNHPNVPIAVDVTKEIIKNVTMTVPAIQRYRLNRPRAGVRFTGKDSELRRYAFQGLDTGCVFLLGTTCHLCRVDCPDIRSV